MTETVLVPGARRVRGTLSSSESTTCVVACPPDPRHGGSRSDPRLKIVADALGERATACLRFDYGPWDEGRGERTDAANAIAWARERYDRVGLFGYSFGAAVALSAAAVGASESLCAISVLGPPARVGSIDAVAAVAAIAAVASGGDVGDVGDVGDTDVVDDADDDSAEDVLDHGAEGVAADAADDVADNGAADAALDVADEGTDLGVPLQVCYGERDDTVDWKPVVEAARSAGADVVSVPADHHFLGERERLGESVAEFVTTHC